MITNTHKSLATAALKPPIIPENLDTQRIETYIVNHELLKLLYPFQCINDHILKSLTALAEEKNVIHSFNQMIQGDIVNQSEKRPALHTLLRAFNQDTSYPLKKYAQSLKLDIENEHFKLKKFLEQLSHAGLPKDIIIIGIGSSELGPKAILESLRNYKTNNMRFHFASNIDIDTLEAISAKVDLKNTLVITISKSGSTTETKLIDQYFRNIFQNNTISPFNHFISITTKKSKIDDSSLYKHTFYLDSSIGGRYSSTSMVGLLILGLALGYESCLLFLEGAFQMDQACQIDNIQDNPALLSALLNYWNHTYLKIPAHAILPYSDALSLFPAHLQQLIMESNGKILPTKADPVVKSSCPIIFGGVGTNVQHSFFQHIHQSPQVTSSEFICVKHPNCKKDDLNIHQELQVNAAAQAMALALGQESDNPNQSFSGNRPSQVIVLPNISPKTIGALLAFYENRTVY